MGFSRVYFLDTLILLEGGLFVVLVLVLVVVLVSVLVFVFYRLWLLYDLLHPLKNK